MNPHIETLKEILKKEQHDVNSAEMEIRDIRQDGGKTTLLEMRLSRLKEREAALTAAIADMESKPKLIDAIKQILALDPDYSSQTDDELREAQIHGYTHEIVECATVVLNARKLLSEVMKGGEQDD